MNQEQQRAVQARGDLAVTSLQAIRSMSQTAQMRLLVTVQRLQKLKMPMQTEDGTPTIGNILLTELDILNKALTDIFAVANTVTTELNALAEDHGVARPLDETINDVVGYIQMSNPTYASKSADEIKKEFGL